jgi:hypothetical protein
MQVWELDRLRVAAHHPQILRSDEGANRVIVLLLPQDEALQEHQVHEQALAVECIDADDGWAIWRQALATAALVPASKARRFKNTLAEMANADTRSLPLELHDFVWEVLSNGNARLPSESPTHTQRSAAPNPVSISDWLQGLSGVYRDRINPVKLGQTPRKSN